MLAASCGFSDGFGAAVTPGGCPAHPSSKTRPHPKEAVLRLQKALRGLADRTHDSKVYAKPDGLVGKRTVAAVNYALPKYANAPEYASGELTKTLVIDKAPQLAAIIEKAPFISAKVTSGIYRSPAPAIQTAALAPVSATASSTGANMPPYYGPPPPPAYYPPSYGPPRVGGLPADRASVDIKTFIPAQYEHVRFNPGTIALILGVGVVVYALASKGGRGKGKD